MQLPGIVASELGDEEVAAEVALGGDDRLFVTPTRTLVYRAGGVLSEESVATYPHDAERLTVSEGRRKATVTFEYAVEDDRDLSVPTGRLEDALQPVLAAVMQESGATAPGERVHRVFSFSELTLVVTDERLFKHVGAVLWDADHETIDFDAVTGLSYEEGSVATGIVLTVDGRVERLKTPNDRLAEVRDHLESALLGARDADSLADLGDEEDDEDAATTDPRSAVTDFGGVAPLSTGDGERSRAESAGRPAGQVDPAHRETDPDGEGAGGIESRDADGDDRADSATTDDGDGDDDTTAPEETPFTESLEPAGTGSDDDVAEELAALREAVERQSTAIERLTEALRDDDAD